MSRRRTVTLTAPEHGYGRWCVRFAYDAELVETLKAAVYWREREWDGDARCWWVSSLVVDDMADALVAEGATVRRLDADGQPLADPPPEPPPDWAQPSWAEGVLTAVGPQRRDAVFRALSRVLHPDTETGDGDLMRELITARELVSGYAR